MISSFPSILIWKDILLCWFLSWHCSLANKALSVKKAADQILFNKIVIFLSEVDAAGHLHLAILL